MLPSLVATELQGRISEFLRTTFPATTPGFLRSDGRTMLDDILAQPDMLLKGVLPDSGHAVPHRARGRNLTPSMGRRGRTSPALSGVFGTHIRPAASLPASARMMSRGDEVPGDF